MINLLGIRRVVRRCLPISLQFWARVNRMYFLLLRTTLSVVMTFSGYVFRIGSEARFAQNGI